ncbi:MAG: metallophosphoesterase [Eubacteriales bacterium]
MSLFVIGDTHLSLGVKKEMDIFGGNWVGYMDKLEKSLTALSTEDVLVLCGDMGWGMTLEQSLKDFQFLSNCPAKIILVKGNHDYWWVGIKKMETFFQEHYMSSFSFLHNNCIFYDEIALCGTRGWFYEEDRGEHSAKVFRRELLRLETSLKSAGEKEKFCFIHYPPLANGYCCQEILELLKKYDVKRCYYGHLHGKQHKIAVESFVDGIEFHLISADYLNCVPKKVL